MTVLSVWVTDEAEPENDELVVLRLDIITAILSQIGKPAFLGNFFIK
ncbi:hypothetical protein ACFOWM_09085 [Ferruginibacter yonginensis]|uniref:Uncharacterized protein n=1 Tax=Ferruginibacter yonginensis TaxID=1310416 RepID=A0ABV8QRZ7_9BACT